MDAFWKIYTSTPIDRITIGAIAKNAGIHRSTFYEYFKDIYDLLDQFETDLLEQIEHDFLNIAEEHSSSHLQERPIPMSVNDFMNSTLTFFTKYGELLCHLLGSSGDPSFRKKCLIYSKHNLWLFTIYLMIFLMPTTLLPLYLPLYQVIWNIGLNTETP